MYDYQNWIILENGFILRIILLIIVRICSNHLFASITKTFDSSKLELDINESIGSNCKYSKVRGRPGTSLFYSWREENESVEQLYERMEEEIRLWRWKKSGGYLAAIEGWYKVINRFYIYIQKKISNVCFILFVSYNMIKITWRNPLIWDMRTITFMNLLKLKDSLLAFRLE